MYSRELNTCSHELWPTVIGLELHTLKNGDIQWDIFEDTREVVWRIPITDVPHRVTDIESYELLDCNRLAGSVFTVTYKGEMCVLKAYEAVHQNKLFQSELEAQLKL